MFASALSISASSVVRSMRRCIARECRVLHASALAPSPQHASTNARWHRGTRGASRGPEVAMIRLAWLAWLMCGCTAGLPMTTDAGSECETDEDCDDGNPCNDVE